MGLGTSLFLIALGAVLRFAVHVSTRGFSLHTIGLILMIVGIVGLVISVLWMTTWAGRRRRSTPYDAYEDSGVPRTRAR
jgi:hypothetical protein